MASTDTATDATGARAAAEACRAADHLRIAVHADGAALAAAGLIAAACAALGTTYQVSPVRTRAALERRLGAVDDGSTALVVGAEAPDVTSIAGDRPSLTALEAAERLGAEPDHELALAGFVAGGGRVGDAPGGLLERVDLERRPGIASPTTDAVDALTHTTLAHAPFSGDAEGARSALESAGIEATREPRTAAADRRIASLLALGALEGPGASVTAATSIERAVRPAATDGPFATLEGYADVLCALADRAPGLGIGLALGAAATEPALEAWRDHARAAHGGVRGMDPRGDADGLLVAEADGPPVAVARLVRDYRSSAPAVLVVGDGEAGLATTGADAPTIESAAGDAGGTALAGPRTGYARFDPAEAGTLVEAVRGALA